jgi:hypothetical protein
LISIYELKSKIFCESLANGGLADTHGTDQVDITGGVHTYNGSTVKGIEYFFSLASRTSFQPGKIH